MGGGGVWLECDLVGRDRERGWVESGGVESRERRWLESERLDWERKG